MARGLQLDLRGRERGRRDLGDRRRGRSLAGGRGRRERRDHRVVARPAVAEARLAHVLLRVVRREVVVLHLEAVEAEAAGAVATLRAFRESADTISESELQRALKSLEKGEAPEAVLNALARGLTNKLIHSPSVQMKKASAEGRDEFLLLIRELYELESDAD
mgnify:CR=1 FL=1